jgi:two-component system OmpR family response regulator
MTEPLQRILIVEDDPDIREIARVALTLVGGFTVELCASGEEALNRAVAFRPHLILLDVMLPGLDGPATLRALRKVPTAAGVPVVFLTAKVLEPEIECYRAHGAAGIIAKPFDPMALADQVRQIWRLL